MLNINRRLGLLALAVSFVPVPFCTAADAPAGDKKGPIAIASIKRSGLVDFEKDVLPFLSTSCLACHNKTKAKSGLVLETPADIRKGGENGPAVVPGKSLESLLLKSASHAAGIDAPMPPPSNKVAAPDLTPQQLGMLKLWIDQGATGEVRGSAAPLKWQALSAAFDPILAVSISPNGRFAACGRANRIDIYDLPANKLAISLSDPALKGVAGEGVAHRDMVESLAFSPDGQTLASGSYREVKFWHRTASSDAAKLGDKPAAVIAANTDGTLLATGGEDGVVRLFDAAGKPAGELTGLSSPITALRFSLDGAKLAAVAKNKAIDVWDVAAKKLYSKAENPGAARAVIFAQGGKTVCVGGADGAVSVWKLPAAADGEMKAGKPIKDGASPVVAMDIVAADDANIFYACEDGNVRKGQIDAAAVKPSAKHGAPLTSFAVRKDGKRIATVGADGAIRLWNLDDNKKLAEMKGDAAAADTVATATRVATLAKSEIAYRKSQADLAQKAAKAAGERAQKAKDGLAAAEKAVPDKQKAFDDAKKAKEAGKDEKDDKKAALEKDFAKADDELKRALGAKTAVADEIQLSAKGLEEANATAKTAEAAVKTAEERAKASDTAVVDANKALTASAKSLRAVAFSPDGGLLAAAGEDGIIRTYSGDRGTPADTLGEKKDPVTAILFTGPAKLIAGTDKAPAIAYTITTGWKLDRTVGNVDSPTPFADRVMSLDFSPDGKTLVTGGGVPSRSGEIRLIDAATGSLQRGFDDVHSDTVLAVRFSPDGTRLASASTDRFVRVVDLATGKVTRVFEGHTSHALAVAWNHNGHFIASGGADNAIRFWDVETNERGKVVLGFDKEVPAVAYVGDADQLISVSGEGKVRMVRESGGDVRSFTGATDFVNSVSVTADGSIILAGGNDGTLRAWDATTGTAVASFGNGATTSAEKK